MAFIRRLAVMAGAVVVMIISLSDVALEDGRPAEGAGLPCPAAVTVPSCQGNRCWVAAPMDPAPRPG